MSDVEKFLDPDGLFVTVDKVVHHPEAQTPPEMPHCFAYYLTIHNDTELPVTIRARKWVVTNARGELTVVEGEGVVGQQPCIEPGGEFSYNSYHLLDTERAEAVGSFFGVDGEGRKVRTRIPQFKMVVPE